jgi:hypothetical protein
MNQFLGPAEVRVAGGDEWNQGRLPLLAQAGERRFDASHGLTSCPSKIASV